MLFKKLTALGDETLLDACFFWSPREYMYIYIYVRHEVQLR